MKKFFIFLMMQIILNGMVFAQKAVKSYKAITCTSSTGTRPASMYTAGVVEWYDGYLTWGLDKFVYKQTNREGYMEYVNVTNMANVAYKTPFISISKDFKKLRVFQQWNFLNVAGYPEIMIYDYNYIGEGRELVDIMTESYHEQKSQSPISCSSCHGSGLCKYCYGSGKNEYTYNGNCGVCQGTGKCQGCRGKGTL